MSFDGSINGNQTWYRDYLVRAQESANQLYDLTQLFYRSIPDFKTIKEFTWNFFCFETEEQIASREAAILAFEQTVQRFELRLPYLKIPLNLGSRLLDGPQSEEEFAALALKEEEYEEYLGLIKEAYRILNPDSMELEDEEIVWGHAENLIQNLGLSWLYNHLYLQTKKSLEWYQPAYITNKRWTIQNIMQPVANVIHSIFKRLFADLFDQRTEDEIEQIQANISFLMRSKEAFKQENPLSVISEAKMRIILGFRTKDQSRLHSDLNEEQFEATYAGYSQAMMRVISRAFKDLATRGFLFLRADEYQSWSEHGIGDIGYLQYTDAYQFDWGQINFLRSILLERGKWLKVNLTLKSLDAEIKYLQDLLV